MAFTVPTFHTYPIGSTQRIHAYITADAIGTVIADDYFNPVYERLLNGDFIFVASSSGGTMAGDMLLVTSATGAVAVTTINCT